MAESLRRLVNIGSFTVLQDKLKRWSSDYYTNTCDQNSARCCEIIELNAKVQGQLFKLLSLCAQEGGLYGGTNIIKSRLLPWLGQNFFTSGGAVTADTSLSVLAEASAKERELSELQDMYEKSLNDLDKELQNTQAENRDLKDELQEAKIELDRSLRSSSSDKVFTELEVKELKRKLADAQEEIVRLRIQCGLAEDYERKVQTLRDGLYLSSGSKPLRLPAPPSLPRVSKSYTPSYRSKPGLTSPLSMDDPVQRIRQQNAVARFNDLFAQDRLDAMDTLRRYSDDHENNQRIIFAAINEAFTQAKTAFRQFKMKTRASLAQTHQGLESLEEAVQDYINRNTELLDTPGLVSDVIRALNRSSKIFLPPDTTFAIIQPFIREAVRLAWHMSALAHPLDLAAGNDAELFDDSKYRRSYDSEYTAPLVNHHIWPALIQGVRVVVKGEVHTRRGASLSTPKRGRSPTRAVSPGFVSRPRSVSPSRYARSRSPSPFRRPLSPGRLM
ncbi:mitochondria-eating protein-like [Babylonia areolata]|uniref:mitochondria-eating protein-like n=1 Tax=Babylonia areolata TaxID=304850 RepID=UPI003FCF9CFC